MSSVAAKELTYRAAGFWRRAVAAVVDMSLAVPFAVLFGGASSAIAGGALPRLEELGLGYVVHLVVDGGKPGFVALTTAAAAIFLYDVLFVASSGMTPGMRLLRVRVVDRHGRSPSVLRALLRSTALFLSLCLFGLGFLWVAFAREKRGWHDHFAGTYAVRASRQAAPATLGATLT